MSKRDFETGSSLKQDFVHWINERHQIYTNRFIKRLPKPWTEDPIFQQWKFTNVFRQLDTGTIALHHVLEHQQIENCTNEDIIFTVIWYRLFNWYEHIYNLGMTPATIEGYNKVENYIKNRYYEDKKIFTSAHMLRGFDSECKHLSYLRAIKIALDHCHNIAMICENNSMELAFYELLKILLIGDFIAYEIVCDLRFTKVLCHAKDKMTWANIGPGAKRGLRRLGMEISVGSMIKLHDYVSKNADYNILVHFGSDKIYPPFELREIEHSLCEFDKYERIRKGEGRPKQKYKGV